jgi:hypothetical protein
MCINLVIRQFQFKINLKSDASKIFTLNYFPLSIRVLHNGTVKKELSSVRARRLKRQWNDNIKLDLFDYVDCIL